ncbi:membrane-associated tyrosine- and threonine-specific cdc2-inhibitory kinase-like [Gastrophryne carolinensis]
MKQAVRQTLPLRSQPLSVEPHVASGHDFGLMVELDTADGSRDAQEGDPRYMAPELLNGVFTKAADVLSLGMTLLEVACNMELPKGGDGWQQLRQGHLPTEFTSELPPDFLKVLGAMLEPDCRCQATVDWLLSLPAIRRAERWRGVALTGRRVVARVSDGLQLVVWLVVVVLHMICRPVLWLWRRWGPAGMLRSPPTSPSPALPGDSSMSSEWDDDSFGDDVFEVPPSPLGMPRNFTYHGAEFPLRHSPEQLARASLGSTSTPCKLSPDYKRPALPLSPNISRISQDSPRSVKSLTPDSSSGFVDAEGQRSTFLPRNLITMFDEACDE